MKLMNIHFQSKQLILHEIFIGPRCVMVPVGSIAYLKTSTNNSKERNMHKNGNFFQLMLITSCKSATTTLPFIIFFARHRLKGVYF